MKRILYVLIALCTFSGAYANTGSNNGEAGDTPQSCSCDPSTLSLGPITFIQSSSDCSSYVINVPPVTGCSSVKVSQNYNFKIYNPSGVLIYEANEPWDGTLFDFGTYPPGAYEVQVTYSMVDDAGCPHTLPKESEIFNWTGCCSCDPDDLVLGPISFIESPLDCASYSIEVPKVTGCLSVEVSASYTFKIFNSNGLLIHEITTTSDGIIFDFSSYPAQTFAVEVTYTMTDDSGCIHTLPTVSATFDWTECSCPNLTAPLWTDCQQGINPNATFHTLFWSAVPDADYYELEFILNDPECCPNATDPTLVAVFYRNGTSWSIPSDGRCYSWRIRAVCPDGSVSPWSSKGCSCNPSGDDSGGANTKSLTQIDHKHDSENIRLATVPNPATNHVDITFTGRSAEATLSQPKVVIYDMTGKVVYTADLIVEGSNRVDVSGFNPGVFMVTVIDNEGMLAMEKLVVE